MAIINGGVCKVSFGGTTIENLTTNSLDLTMDLRETTNKDTNGVRTYEPSFKNATVSFEGLAADDSTQGYDELFTAYQNRTTLSVEYAGGPAGQSKYSFSALITSLNRTDPNEENSSFSGSMQIVSAITVGTVS